MAMRIVKVKLTEHSQSEELPKELLLSTLEFFIQNTKHKTQNPTLPYSVNFGLKSKNPMFTPKFQLLAALL
jgi:hypothetical protein